MKGWEKVAAVFAGVALAGATIYIVSKASGVTPIAAVRETPILVVDQRNQLPVDLNTAAIFGNTFSARSQWSSDAMGN